LPVIVWLAPTVLPWRLQAPVPPDSVIEQLPPAPLTDTVPVGVPCAPDTVAVIVDVPPIVTVPGLADKETVAFDVLTVSVAVPLPGLYFASPP
jgi:hypothetical protein